MKGLSGIAIIFLLFYLPGCTPSQQTQSEETQKDSVYVVEKAPDTSKEEIAVTEYPDMGMTYYVVQIGAFTTRERAERFASESTAELPYNVRISFSKQNNLYVVQLKDYYTSRSEAEKVRNDLWKNEKFKDAWILTIYK